jgi:hypothetical protein
MRKIVLILTLLASLSALTVGSALATVMVKFNPGGITTNAGSTFNIDVSADILREEALVGWGFDLKYDPTQLQLNSASTSSNWDLLQFGANNLTALLLANPTSPDPGLSGNDVLLATLNFTCLGPGTSELDISVNPQDPIQGFMTFEGVFAEWESIPGTITQTEGVVPEPSTVLLLSTGLAGVVWLSRKKRKV